MGSGWLRPELPDGPLRDLNDALHELHGRSGYRSSRFIAERLRAAHGTGAPSHAKVHQMFIRPELPRPELVLWVVQVLAETIRGLDPDAECDRFDQLWQLAFTRRGPAHHRPDLPPPASMVDLDPAVWTGLFPDAVDNISELHRTAHVDTVNTLVGHYATLVVVLRHQLGPGHPDTLTARHNLAWWQGEIGSLGGALAAFEELSRDRTRVLGHDHPHTFSTRHGVAYYLVLTRDLLKGLAMFEDLLFERERSLSPNHPDTLYLRRCVGWAMGKAGDPAGAIDVLTEVLALQSRVLDEKHPDVLAVRTALASWRGGAGDQIGSLGALEGLLPTLARVFGADHNRVLDARRNILQLRSRVYGPGMVLGTADALLADMTRALGAEHYETLGHRADMAVWHRDAGKRRR